MSSPASPLTRNNTIILDSLHMLSGEWNPTQSFRKLPRTLASLDTKSGSPALAASKQKESTSEFWDKRQRQRSKGRWDIDLYKRQADYSDRTSAPFPTTAGNAQGASTSSRDGELPRAARSKSSKPQPVDGRSETCPRDGPAHEAMLCT